jgi:murein DD-endopeptidase MepM/ murein hydrolase activator NlpD
LSGKKIKNIAYLSFGIMLFSRFSSLYAHSNNDVATREKQKEELLMKNKELKQDLKEQQQEIKSETEKSYNIKSKIKDKESEIDNLNQEILSLEKKIDECKSTILKIDEEMKKKMSALKNALSAIYIAGDTSTLDIILSAKNFEDFLDKAELIRSISQTIADLIKSLKESYLIIAAEKEIIEQKSLDAKNKKTVLLSSQNELQQLYNENEKQLSKLHKEEKELRDEIDENDAEYKAIQEFIKKYYEEQKRLAEERRRREEEEKKRGGKSAFHQNFEKIIGNGTHIWPVPGFNHISSDFYDKENRRNSHGAIDISGHGTNIYGARVIAPASGIITLAATGNNGGYGTCAMIDHGDGVLTILGHLSGLAVSAGNIVKQGDVVGYVGNTGHSTGPHLHWETRRNNVRFDPRTLLK